jgi:hypothetical protein
MNRMEQFLDAYLKHLEEASKGRMSEILQGPVLS